MTHLSLAASLERNFVDNTAIGGAKGIYSRASWIEKERNSHSSNYRLSEFLKDLDHGSQYSRKLFCKTFNEYTH